MYQFMILLHFSAKLGVNNNFLQIHNQKFEISKNCRPIWSHLSFKSEVNAILLNVLKELDNIVTFVSAR